MRQHISRLAVGLFLALFALPACAQDLRLQSGVVVSADTLPYFSKRQGVLKRLNRSNHVMAIAAPPPLCGGYSWTASAAGSVNTAISECDARVQVRLEDYDKVVRTRCRCRFLVRDMVVLDDRQIMNEYVSTPIKLFIQKTNKTWGSVRGFLEYENYQLLKQSFKILNSNLTEVCSGTNPDFRDYKASLSMSCYGGSVKARGVIRVVKKGDPYPGHAIGGGNFEDGTPFYFITRLRNSQINVKYPAFPVTLPGSLRSSDEGGSA